MPHTARALAGECASVARGVRLRSRRRRIALVLLCTFALSATARAEIYRWTDANGQLHFTQNLEGVPPAYREQARHSAAERGPARLQTYTAPADPTRSRAARQDGEIRVPFLRDGSLMRVDVRLNDLLTAPFYIDTGASGIALPSHVAERLGLRIRPDTPHVQVATANGIVARPLVRLASVELGGARVEGLEATLNPSMQIGLLGGAFFNNFVYRVDAAQSEIHLVPNEKMRGGLVADQWRDRFRSVKGPLARLEAYLEENADVLRRGEQARLERRRSELIVGLEELEREANRLEVPYSWRQ